jgi:aminoglycoside 2'-N-acetyltransferase I
VVALQHQAWPPQDPAAVSAGTLTHDPALRPRSMLLIDRGRVLAALDILSKELVHAGRHYLAGGLSTVVTHRDARGQGYGRRLVAAARQAMAAGSLDLGLFACDRPLRGFYEGAGWQLLPGAVLVGGDAPVAVSSDQPGFDKVTMAGFFSAAARCHRRSFQHARIELYPGGSTGSGDGRLVAALAAPPLRTS